jgi:hypothetical protein
MAQHDMNVGDASGAVVRADINSALAAIISNSSGATEPATMFANMWWYDTSTATLKRRNNANDAWIVLGLESADTDGTLAANSDVKVATQKATKTYVDAKTIAENRLSLSDNTTANASTSAHGLLKKLSNVATEFMNGVGNWVSITIDALLPTQTGNSGKFLTTNGSVSSWGTVSSSGYSNVVFGWSNYTAGSFDPDAIANAAQVIGSTYQTILVGRFLKVAGVSTITVNARLWSTSADSNREAFLNIDVGGQSTTAKSVTSTTPAWYAGASTINVSSLSNGTAYDITIQLKNEVGAGSTAYCSGVVLFGS